MKTGNAESTSRQRQLIQIRRKKAGMDHDCHVDFMSVRFGKTSAVELTMKEAEAYLEYLASKGYSGKRPPMAGTMTQDEYLASLWQKLGKKGLVKDASEAALNKMAKKVSGVDHLQWCSKKQKTNLIYILKKMLKE